MGFFLSFSATLLFTLALDSCPLQAMANAQNLAIARCYICERIVTHTNHLMATTSPTEKNEKKERSRKHAHANKILETACHDKALVSVKVICDDLLEELEAALTNYIVLGKVDENADLSLCGKVCPWKNALFKSMQSIQDQVHDSVAKMQSHAYQQSMRQEEALLEQNSWTAYVRLVGKHAYIFVIAIGTAIVIALIVVGG